MTPYPTPDAPLPSTRDPFAAPANAKVACFWDLENCAIPNGVPGYKVANNICRIAMEYGSVSVFKAYEALSETVSPRTLQLRSELQASGVSLIDTPHAGRKEVADKMIISDLLAFALDNPAPATVVLISGDRDFAYTISLLRQRLYRVVLVAPSVPEPHVTLKSQAAVVLEWRQGSIVQPSTKARQPAPPSPEFHRTGSASSSKAPWAPRPSLAAEPTPPASQRSTSNTSIWVPGGTAKSPLSVSGPPPKPLSLSAMASPFSPFSPRISAIPPLVIDLPQASERPPSPLAFETGDVIEDVDPSPLSSLPESTPNEFAEECEPLISPGATTFKSFSASGTPGFGGAGLPQPSYFGAAEGDTPDDEFEADSTSQQPQVRPGLQLNFLAQDERYDDDGQQQDTPSTSTATWSAPSTSTHPPFADGTRLTDPYSFSSVAAMPRRLSMISEGGPPSPLETYRPSSSSAFGEPTSETGAPMEAQLGVGEVPPATPSAPSFIVPNTDLMCFIFLIAILEQFRLEGEPRPNWGRVGSELRLRNARVYEFAAMTLQIPITGFKDYIKAAAAAGIVRFGEKKNGFQWVGLHKRWKCAP